MKSNPPNYPKGFKNYCADIFLYLHLLVFTSIPFYGIFVYTVILAVAVLSVFWVASIYEGNYSFFAFTYLIIFFLIIWHQLFHSFFSQSLKRNSRNLKGCLSTYRPVCLKTNGITEILII